MKKTSNKQKNMKKIIPAVLGVLFLTITMFSGVGAADVTSGGNKIDPKPAGGYVTSAEFNNIVDTLRGIYNTFNGSVYSWGINKSPAAGITLDIDGPITFGANTHSSACDGNFAGSIYFNSTNNHFWYCNGTDWQQMDGSLPSPINGICDNSSQNGCSAGVANDGAVADTSTLWKWACDGQYGGTIDSTCQKEKPINGVCDNSSQNGCSAGVANDGAVADTSTLWKWACDGQYGGITDVTCEKNKIIGACGVGAIVN
jgi:predicted heme/steroid binding protein